MKHSMKSKRKQSKTRKFRNSRLKHSKSANSKKNLFSMFFPSRPVPIRVGGDNISPTPVSSSSSSNPYSYDYFKQQSLQAYNAAKEKTKNITDSKEYKNISASSNKALTSASNLGKNLYNVGANAEKKPLTAAWSGVKALGSASSLGYQGVKSAWNVGKMVSKQSRRRRK
jgi:hypothetical protein